MKYIFLLGVFLLSGCAVTYDCNLGYECQDSMEALEAAKSNGGNSERVLYEVENPPLLNEGDGGGATYKNDYGRKQWQHDHPYYGARKQKGGVVKFGKQNYQSKPVYIPDAPMRIWLAPMRTDGILVGDYYIYTKVPGGFSVGNGEERKALSLGQYGPLDRNKDLGFTPDVKEVGTKVLPR